MAQVFNLNQYREECGIPPVCGEIILLEVRTLLEKAILSATAMATELRLSPEQAATTVMDDIARQISEIKGLVRFTWTIPNTSMNSETSSK